MGRFCCASRRCDWHGPHGQYFSSCCGRSAGIYAAQLTILDSIRTLRTPPSSRHARGWRDRGWPCDQLCEPTKVLCDRRQRELELGTARPAQSQAAEPQDAL